MNAFQMKIDWKKVLSETIKKMQDWFLRSIKEWRQSLNNGLNKKNWISKNADLLLLLHCLRVHWMHFGRLREREKIANIN